MKKLGLQLLLCMLSFSAVAQSYSESIMQFRQKYKNDFLTDNHSPLKAADTSYLRFYGPDQSYCITATFTPANNAEPFQMPTHTNKQKKFRTYGVATFKLHHRMVSLHIYQSLELSKDPKYKDYLFLPFTDETNYKETYGGGRYLDITIQDIKDGKIVLDFNKAYNPYCAYASGYSCPIPPTENDLPVPVKAGEKLFGKKVAE